MKNIELTEFQKIYWKKKGRYCPLCGQLVVGDFISTCINKDCPNFKYFAVEKCKICRRQRFECNC